MILQEIKVIKINLSEFYTHIKSSFQRVYKIGET
jgi:hypothetical protein